MSIRFKLKDRVNKQCVDSCTSAYRCNPIAPLLTSINEETAPHRLQLQGESLRKNLIKKSTEKNEVKE